MEGITPTDDDDYGDDYEGEVLLNDMEDVSSSSTTTRATTTIAKRRWHSLPSSPPQQQLHSTTGSPTTAAAGDGGGTAVDGAGDDGGAASTSTTSNSNTTTTQYHYPSTPKRISRRLADRVNLFESPHHLRPTITTTGSTSSRRQPRRSSMTGSIPTAATSSNSTSAATTDPPVVSVSDSDNKLNNDPAAAGGGTTRERGGHHRLHHPHPRGRNDDDEDDNILTSQTWHGGNDGGGAARSRPRGRGGPPPPPNILPFTNNDDDRTTSSNVDVAVSTTVTDATNGDVGGGDDATSDDGDDFAEESSSLPLAPLSPEKEESKPPKKKTSTSRRKRGNKIITPSVFMSPGALPLRFVPRGMGFGLDLDDDEGDGDGGGGGDTNKDKNHQSNKATSKEDDSHTWHGKTKTSSTFHKKRTSSSKSSAAAVADVVNKEEENPTSADEGTTSSSVLPKEDHQQNPRHADVATIPQQRRHSEKHNTTSSGMSKPSPQKHRAVSSSKSLPSKSTIPLRRHSEKHTTTSSGMSKPSPQKHREVSSSKSLPSKSTIPLRRHPEKHNPSVEWEDKMQQDSSATLTITGSNRSKGDSGSKGDLSGHSWHTSKDSSQHQQKHQRYQHKPNKLPPAALFVSPQSQSQHHHRESNIKTSKEKAEEELKALNLLDESTHKPKRGQGIVGSIAHNFDQRNATTTAASLQQQQEQQKSRLQQQFQKKTDQRERFRNINFDATLAKFGTKRKQRDDADKPIHPKLPKKLIDKTKRSIKKKETGTTTKAIGTDITEDKKTKKVPQAATQDNVWKNVCAAPLPRRSSSNDETKKKMIPEIPIYDLTNDQKQMIETAIEGNFLLDDLLQKRSDKDKNDFVSAFEPVTFDTKGDVIESCGKASDQYYIVQKGSVDFIDDVTKEVLGTATEGMSFGQLNLLYSAMTDTTVVAAQEGTVLLKVGQDTFRNVMQRGSNADAPPSEEAEAAEATSDAVTTAATTSTGDATSDVNGATDVVEATSMEKKQTKDDTAVSSSDDDLLLLTKRRQQVRNYVESNVRYEDLEKISILGEGQFGEVWLVAVNVPLPTAGGGDSSASTDCNNNIRLKFALKSQSKEDDVRGTEAAEMIQREMDMMKQITDHPLVAELVTTYDDPSYIYALLGLLPGGELWDLIHREDPPDSGDWVNGIPEAPNSKFYAILITDTLCYIHSKKIIYRDMKPENIMLDRDGYPVIVDFGFAKQLGDGPKNDRTFTFCGTPNYVSPEIIQNSGHSYGADYWALGVLIYEMTVGENPWYFDGMDQMDLYHSICHDPPYAFSEDSGLSTTLRDLVERLLEKDPEKRLGVVVKKSPQQLGQAILDHEWFEGMDLTQLRKKQVVAPYIPPRNATDEEELRNQELFFDHMMALAANTPELSSPRTTTTTSTSSTDTEIVREDPGNQEAEHEVEETQQQEIRSSFVAQETIQDVGTSQQQEFKSSLLVPNANTSEQEGEKCTPNDHPSDETAVTSQVISSTLVPNAVQASRLKAADKEDDDHHVDVDDTSSMTRKSLKSVPKVDTSAVSTNDFTATAATTQEPSSPFLAAPTSTVDKDGLSSTDNNDDQEVGADISTSSAATHATSLKSVSDAVPTSTEVTDAEVEAVADMSTSSAATHVTSLKSVLDAVPTSAEVTDAEEEAGADMSTSSAATLATSLKSVPDAAPTSTEVTDAEDIMNVCEAAVDTSATITNRASLLTVPEEAAQVAHVPPPAATTATAPEAGTSSVASSDTDDDVVVHDVDHQTTDTTTKTPSSLKIRDWKNNGKQLQQNKTNIRKYTRKGRRESKNRREDVKSHLFSTLGGNDSSDDLNFDL